MHVHTCTIFLLFFCFVDSVVYAFVVNANCMIAVKCCAPFRLRNYTEQNLLIENKMIKTNLVKPKLSSTHNSYRVHWEVLIVDRHHHQQQHALHQPYQIDPDRVHHQCQADVQLVQHFQHHWFHRKCSTYGQIYISISILTQFPFISFMGLRLWLCLHKLVYIYLPYAEFCSALEIHIFSHSHSTFSTSIFRLIEVVNCVSIQFTTISQYKIIFDSSIDSFALWNAI